MTARIAPLLAAALLTISWPPGEGPTLTHEAATTLDACTAAAEAALQGRGLPLGRSHPALRALCTPATPAEAGFAPGWDCIAGFNCGATRPRQ